MDKAGQLRSVDVKPTGSAFSYLPASQVDPQLRLLIHWMTVEMQKKETLEQRITAVATFLSAFLYILPFRDGNGRVARVLTSLLFGFS